MKALFFDIDGTLLSEITREVPKSAIDALQETTEKGNLIFINTGRTWAGLPAMFRSMPFSGYLCGCGTYIQFGDNVLMHHAIDGAKCEAIPKFLKECHADTILEGTEDIFLTAPVSRFEGLELTRRHFQTAGVGMERSADDKGIVYDKFVIFTDEQTDLQKVLTELRKEFDVMDRQNGFYEVVPQGYTKGTAIEYVLQHFGIAKEDAYVFGDSSNDLAMFQCGVHSIALGTHDPILDPYTEYVTDTVENDGIAKAMKHFGLI